MQYLTGFAPLAARYDGFIIDLWGVVHDGVRAYPGAVDTLTRLRDAGKKAILLSNAPRRADAVQQAMRHMGIADDLYSGIMTSGEATHLMLRDRSDPWYAALGRRVFHLGPARDRGVLEGLDLVPVDRLDEAEFLLNTGPDDLGNQTEVAEFEQVLQEARRHGLKMICANPDLEVIRGGQRVICAGALAKRYEELGGEVRALGKPDPAIYGPVLDQLALPAGRVLAVGDGLRTDIAGAKAAEIDACWVLGGIHHHEPDPAATAAGHGLAPVACIPAFVW
jgi:HAD superfamily hydrolase (TIGR01459 family)